MATLLGCGADVHSTRLHSGVTPLWLAAAGGHANVISLLLAKGADPNVCRYRHCGRVAVLVVAADVVSFAVCCWCWWCCGCTWCRCGRYCCVLAAIAVAVVVVLLPLVTNFVAIWSV